MWIMGLKELIYTWYDFPSSDTVDWSWFLILDMRLCFIWDFALYYVRRPSRRGPWEQGYGKLGRNNDQPDSQTLPVDGSHASAWPQVRVCMAKSNNEHPRKCMAVGTLDHLRIRLGRNTTDFYFVDHVLVDFMWRWLVTWIYLLGLW